MVASDVDRGEGYVTDSPYIDAFHAGLGPGNLAAAAAASGIMPPDPDRPFAYLDLGCGSGFTTTLIAAGHPQADVWGIDFMPEHIARARETARAAGVGNVTFLEASFADLRPEDMPRFDFVVAHGIWSWISPANRTTILALLARCVAPGGLVMISYNCHPGWAPLIPLRDLLLVNAGQEGSSAERIERALTQTARLRDAGADLFRHNSAAATALDQMRAADRTYLAHEYLNENWTVFHPREVHGALAGAGFAYAGQAQLANAQDRWLLSAEQAALVAGASGVTEREVVRDAILNRRFRHDLFVRGEAHGGQATEWFDGRRFALVRPTHEAMTVETRAGTIPLTAVQHAIVAVLARGPATGAAIIDQVAAGEVDRRDAGDALMALLAVHCVALAPHGMESRDAAARRFNAAALDDARMAAPWPALLSPVTGAGIKLTGADQLLFDAARAGVPLEFLSMGDDESRIDRFREHVLPLLGLLGID